MAHDSKIPKEKLQTIIVSEEFFTNPKILLLTQKFGPMVPLWIQRLWLAIGREGGELAKDLVGGIGYLCLCDEGIWLEFIAECVQKKIIYESESGYRSEVLDSEIVSVAKKRERWRKEKGIERGSVSASVPMLTRDTSVSIPDSVPEPIPETIKKRLSVCEVSEHRTQNTEHRTQKIDQKNGQGGGSAPPEPETEALRQARTALEPESSEKVQSSNAFICAGRRCMKKYPDLWFTEDELAHTFQVLVESGIPANRLSLVFGKVAGRIATEKTKGKKVELISAVNWATGWAKTETLKELKDETDLARSKKYLKNAEDEKR